MNFTAALRRRWLRLKIKRGTAAGEPISYRHKGRVRWVNAESATVYHVEHSTTKLEKMTAVIPGTPRVVMDIGANCGLFAAFVKERFPDVRVICCEPAPDLARVIRKNCGSGVELLPYAIDDRCGRAKFYVNGASQQTNSLLKSAADLYSEGNVLKEVEVEVRTLDSVCSDLHLTRVDVVKLDIQGAEFRALAGARQMLAGVGVIFIESTWMEIDSVSRVVPFARESGFRFLHIVGEVKMGADIMLTREPLNRDIEVVRSFDLNTSP